MSASREILSVAHSIYRARLEVKDESHATANRPHRSGIELAHTLREHLAINSDDMGHVGDGLPGQAGSARGQKHISGCIEESQVRRNGHNNDGTDPAPIECVALHDDYRVAKTRSGTPRVVQIGPPDLPALNYHSERSST